MMPLFPDLHPMDRHFFSFKLQDLDPDPDQMLNWNKLQKGKSDRLRNKSIYCTCLLVYIGIFFKCGNT